MLTPKPKAARPCNTLRLVQKNHPSLWRIHIYSFPWQKQSEWEDVQQKLDAESLKLLRTWSTYVFFSPWEIPQTPMKLHQEPRQEADPRPVV